MLWIFLAQLVRVHLQSLTQPDFLQMPITSVDMMLNGESIEEADLVAWLSMGIIHVPRTEVCHVTVLTLFTALGHWVSQHSQRQGKGAHAVLGS